jgi:hypothetical protein
MDIPNICKNICFVVKTRTEARTLLKYIQYVKLDHINSKHLSYVIMHPFKKLV